MTAIAEHVLDITRDLFAALVDGEPGHVTEWSGDGAALTDPVHAWVDIRGEHALRATVTTDRGTADRIARALLAMTPGETVAREDAQDALGEMANVIGGNLKGLMSASAVLSAPAVASGAVRPPGDPEWERRLGWRDQPLVISMWQLDPDTGGKGQTQ